MCGIAGIISRKGTDQVRQNLEKAHNIQQHRGPDAMGSKYFQLDGWSIGFAHQRLSIIDLSPAGNQPMTYNDGSTIIYNGEIYNYLEIKEILCRQGCHFNSNTDTEVLMAALSKYGVSAALNLCNGMWGFAWCDRQNHQLIIARDRFGIKPLYYYCDDSHETLYFASEIKTILEMAPVKFKLDYQIVGEYLTQSLAETSENTYFKGIKKIPPACYLKLDLSSPQISIDFKRYWQLSSYQRMIDTPADRLKDEIRDLFFDAVKVRLRSDVPVGVLLSGGIDSSAIAAAMKSLLGEADNINLISAVSDDPRFDESSFIDIMAKFLDCQVYKVNLKLDSTNALGLLNEVCWYNDEPVGSFSNVAHYLLMQKAKEQGITVILSGQGADEILCGYRKYLGFYIQQLLRDRHYCIATKVILGFLNNKTIVKQFSLAEAKRYLPSFMQTGTIDYLGEQLEQFKPLDLGLQPGMNLRDRQMADLYRFSVPILTHYEDRMSMAWAREVRVPFLDYRLVDRIINLSPQYKLNNGWTKYIFREAMDRYLPSQIAWRKDKQGFINPQSDWMKHELKDAVLRTFHEDAYIFKWKLIKRPELIRLYDVFCRQKTGNETIWFKDIFNPLALEIWIRKFERYIAR